MTPSLRMHTPPPALGAQQNRSERPVHAYRRLAIWPSWAAVVGLLVLAATPVTLPSWAYYAPFVLSLVLLGLPHGAADHVVLLRLRDAPFALGPLLQVIAPYLLLSGAYLTVWFIAPVAAFIFFIGLTWFHWGQGDVHSLLVLHGAQHLPSRTQRALTLLVRGGLPMLVPLLAFPERYREVTQHTVGVLTATPLSADTVVFSDTFRLGATIAFAALVLLHFALSYRHAGSTGRLAWWTDLAEVLLLAIFFMLVHPVLAVGVYFCLWHAPRHLARLLAYDAPSHRAVQQNRLGPGLKWLAIHTTPTTLAALTLLGGLYVLVPYPPDALPQFVGLYLVLIAVLTLPHVWVVCRMDRAEAIW